LGPLLGLQLPDNDFTAALAPQDRQGALRALLRECLSAAAREAGAEGRGLLLVLEDLHWIDATSDDLLLDLAQVIADLPVLIMLAYRPPTAPQAAPQVTRLAGFTSIELTGLDATAAEQLIRAKLLMLFPAKAGALPLALVAQLTERAQGNPFYLEELLSYLRDRAIDPYDPAALDAVELPDSLHTLILSRLDALSARQQITLKTASVIGRRFLVAWLSGAFPETIAPDAITAELAVLAQLELTPLDSREPELAYLFKHIVTREVAYASLGHATRATLHEQLAAYLERLAGIDRNQFVDLLAYHYEQSDNLAKKREYLRWAGEAAAARYANDAAVAYLSRALELAPASDLVERVALLLAREQVYGIQGERAAQRTDLEALNTLVQQLDDSGLRAEVALRRGRYAERTSDYPTASGAAQEAVRWAQAAQRAALEATGYQRWGWALLRQRDYAGARAQLDRSLALARAIGDEPQACLTLNDLGGLAAEQGDYAAARDSYEQSLALARRLGDRRQECRVLGNLGTLAGEQGDLTAARGYLEDNLAIARAIGDRQMAGVMLGNLGFTLANQGDYATARGYLEQSLALTRATHDQLMEAAALNNLGLVAVNQGDFVTARNVYERCLKLAQDLGDPVFEGWARRGLGNAALGVQDLDVAEEAYRQALATLRAVDNPALVAEPLAALARVVLARGEAAEARETIEEILAHLATGTLEGAEEPMLVYLICYQVLRANDDPRAQTLLTRARRELLAQAGHIPDEATRHAILEHVPAHRELLAAWAAQPHNGNE
jgi:predicted ATPase